jgi:BirA family transcriptional regulator, biotin operon repressor / biotin---[acetyl-CoA-carboxylase] ligase
MTAGADPGLRTPPHIIRCGVVDSTQAVAFALAERGAPDRTVVVADSQLAGRGRQGRPWRDEPGASLLLSLLARPRLAPAQWPLLSLATGVAVARSLHRVAGIAPRLKWPNDVLVDGRKVCGILLESRSGPPPTVVIGVGINLLQGRFPAELEGRATSILLASGRRVERECLLMVFLEEFDDWHTRLEREGFAPVREAWKGHSATLGRRVVGKGVSGQAVDLDEHGALVIDDGARRYRMIAGELEEAIDAARR